MESATSGFFLICSTFLELHGAPNKAQIIQPYQSHESHRGPAIRNSCNGCHMLAPQDLKDIIFQCHRLNIREDDLFNLAQSPFPTELEPLLAIHPVASVTVGFVL